MGRDRERKRERQIARHIEKREKESDESSDAKKVDDKRTDSVNTTNRYKESRVKVKKRTSLRSFLPDLVVQPSCSFLALSVPLSPLCSSFSSLPLTLFLFPLPSLSFSSPRPPSLSLPLTLPLFLSLSYSPLILFPPFSLLLFIFFSLFPLFLCWSTRPEVIYR